MRRPANARKTAAALKTASETRAGFVKIAVVVLALVGVTALYISVSNGNRALDEDQCPAKPSSITVLLVDVTDPMTVAQKQDFQNELVRMRNTIPRYGKLIVTKVDSTSDKLLDPVITRCNPGTAADANDLTGDPKGLQKRYREGFEEPLDKVFEDLSQASGSDSSPIFESVQSSTLTELLTPEIVELPRKLILVSDLLQNTEAISFYSGLPDPDAFLSSPAFRRVRSDLRDVEVEIWMLERSDAPRTQPRLLIKLWERAIGKQGGAVTRVYNVSG
jgi:hypothetical protein